MKVFTKLNKPEYSYKDLETKALKMQEDYINQYGYYPENIELSKEEYNVVKDWFILTFGSERVATTWDNYWLGMKIEVK